MSEESSPRPKVLAFRQILFLPLHLQDQKEIKNLPEPWRPQADPLKEIAEAKEEAWQPEYAEFVYFHPFVQKILYPKPGDRSPRLYTRSDIKGVEVCAGPGDTDAEWQRFEVYGIKLFLFQDCRVAILALEVGAGIPGEAGAEAACSAGTVENLEDFFDRFRRLYPPYWWGISTDTYAKNPGHCFLGVRWLGSDNAPLSAEARSDLSDTQYYRDWVKNHRVAPVAPHWAYLLKPLLQPGGESRWAAHQIGDERLPFMAWIALDKPRALTRGDWMRLTFADDRGLPDQYPYASPFMRNFERRYCYDRYWGRAPEVISTDQDWFTTRYLCAGYTFLMVGQDDPRFFSDEQAGAFSHFHHHYFQMGLIVHLHRAALLALSDEVAEAVREFNAKQGSDQDFDGFSSTIAGLHQRSLVFTQGYWFAEISSQMQAQELFHWWSERLGTQRLYAQLHTEVAEINEFVEAHLQKRESENTQRLTYIATAALVPTLAATLLAVGMGSSSLRHLFVNLLPNDLSQLFSVGALGSLGAFLGALALSVLMVWFFYQWVRWIFGGKGSSSKKV